MFVSPAQPARVAVRQRDKTIENFIRLSFLVVLMAGISAIRPGRRTFGSLPLPESGPLAFVWSSPRPFDSIEHSLTNGFVDFLIRSIVEDIDFVFDVASIETNAEVPFDLHRSVLPSLKAGRKFYSAAAASMMPAVSGTLTVGPSSYLGGAIRTLSLITRRGPLPPMSLSNISCA